MASSDKVSKKDKSLKTKKEGKESKKRKADANAVDMDTENSVAVEEVRASDAADKKKKSKKEKKDKSVAENGEKKSKKEKAVDGTEEKGDKKKKKSKGDGAADSDSKKSKRAAAETQDTEKPVAKKAKTEEGAKPAAKSGGHAPKASRIGKHVRREFYVESAAVKAKSAAEVEKWHKENSITLESPDGKDFRPITSWDEAADSVPDNILSVCRAFPKPTPIQAQAWPVCLSGRDMIGIAKTGSGKTMAFGVPSVVHALDQAPVTKKPKERGPIVLVLSPTRELAMQTAAVYENIGKATHFSCACIYGGVSKDQQRRDTQNGVHVVVATPGRLLNLMDEGVLNLDRVTYLVLDEADRMLDMGFEPDIRRIVGAMPATGEDRQTVMFSATWPKEIRELAHEFLCDPVKVTIGSQDLTASDSVKQIVEVVDMKDKDKKLLQLMGKYHKGKGRVLVFVLYKKEAPRVERLLKGKGYKVGAVHGDMSQFERTQAVELFKEGKQPVLVATDVCARGLDIPDVEVVINYSFPLTVEDYVHRIGRTGRGGKTGLSHTLFTVADKTLAGPLSDVLREAGADVPEALTKFGYAPTKKKEHKMYGAHYRADDDMPTKKAVKMRFD